jgi:DNA-binding response OmpR family regulator
MEQLKDIKILYIDDEESIRKNGVEFLSFFSEHVYEAIDGVDGYRVYKEVSPDIIICDIMMPRLNGLSLIEKIRKEDKKTEIIVATARVDTDYLLKALELRLVKYLVKPISEDELLSTLKESVEFMQNDSSNIIELNSGYKYDLFNKILFDDRDEIIKLTKKESLFLYICTKNIDRATTYQELENYVWEGMMSDTALKSLVRDIRKKLPKDTLVNISGIGYRINKEQK